MISELDDKEVLEFLMTSDLDGDYSPDELKYLFIKWRYFYRILHGISDRDRIDLEGKVRDLEEKLKSKETEVMLTQVEVANRENLINSMKNRQLTWKERFTGKIITKDNEDRAIQEA